MPERPAYDVGAVLFRWHPQWLSGFGSLKGDRPRKMLNAEHSELAKSRVLLLRMSFACSL